MRTLFLTSMILVCAACTTTKGLQSECSALHERFVDEVFCLNQKLDQESSLKEDSFAREYILFGKVLSRKVSSGALNEDEARLQFARKYNQLLLEQQRYNTLTAVELDALSPRYHDCEFDHATGHARCFEY